ncbi:HAD family hydrolase [Sphingomonas gilva]|nr:HAD-IB family phosphatase [Sphingomonas gilva]
MMPSERAVAIFDVCGTLYDANTTAGFVTYVAERSERRFAALSTAATLSRLSPLRYGLRVVGLVLRRDLGRAVLLHTLRGLPESRLDMWAREYVAERLSLVQIAETHACLRAAQQQGDRVVLVSNSIDPVVRAIAARLNTDYVSSRLEIVDGRATGRLAQDLTGIKHELVEHVRQGCAGRLTVISDNASDAQLLALADRPVIVRHRGKRHPAHAGIEAEFIHVDR